MKPWRISASATVGALILALAAPAFAQNATRTILIPAPSPSAVGQRVTLTAFVDALGGAAPTGSVTFLDGTTTLGAGVLRSAGAGQATLAGGYLFGCALTNAGGVKCWGSNSDGQLGDGTFGTTRPAPVDVTGLATGVTAVDAGGGHTCALTSAGGVKCWGNNHNGQIGDNTNSGRSTPTSVSGLASGVAAVSAGGNHTCAATRFGAARCWGWNRDGQIGDGTSNNSRLTPKAVSGLASGVVAVSAGAGESCALLSTGAIKCWGANGWGQLGNNKAPGTEILSATPVAVSGIASGASALSLGVGYGCAVVVGGVRCWGRNWYGALGDGTTFDRAVPTAVVGLASGVVSVAAGNDHTCAVTSLGAVKCWGRNDFGQVGDGSTDNRLSPVAVSGIPNGAVAVAAGQYHSCALLWTGVVKCWGLNTSGQIGDGTLASPRLTPTTTNSLNALARARAQFSTTALGVGAHTLKATYPGDPTHTGSAGAFPHTVN